MSKMREMPINDFFAKNGRIREDGRMVHDMYVYEVKKPSEFEGRLGLLQASRSDPRRSGVPSAQGQRLPAGQEGLKQIHNTGPGCDRIAGPH